MRCNIGQLLKGVDLTELVLAAEPILGVNFGRKSAHKIKNLLIKYFFRPGQLILRGKFHLDFIALRLQFLQFLHTFMAHSSQPMVHREFRIELTFAMIKLVKGVDGLAVGMAADEHLANISASKNELKNWRKYFLTNLMANSRAAGSVVIEISAKPGPPK